MASEADTDGLCHGDGERGRSDGLEPLRQALAAAFGTATEMLP
ncbi:MAG: hypothetical protein ACRDSP_21840 [Pseudonocardiaceae bacterium]